MYLSSINLLLMNGVCGGDAGTRNSADTVHGLAALDAGTMSQYSLNEHRRNSKKPESLQ